MQFESFDCAIMTELQFHSNLNIDFTRLSFLFRVSRSGNCVLMMY